MRIEILNRGLGLAFWMVLCASPAAAACITPPLSAELINQFKSNHQGLIPNPDIDARTLETTIRDLAGTDPTLAADLVHVAEGARPQFQAAIAAGLAQAALACVSVDQHAALLIQQAVASFEDGQFHALFAAIVGDLSTAATAAAELAATGSVGSVIIVNPVGKSGTRSSPGVAGGGKPGTRSSPGVAGGGGGGSSATGIFAVVGQSSSRADATNTLGKTAGNPVSATR